MYCEAFIIRQRAYIFCLIWHNREHYHNKAYSAIRNMSENVYLDFYFLQHAQDSHIGPNILYQSKLSMRRLVLQIRMIVISSKIIKQEIKIQKIRNTISISSFFDIRNKSIYLPSPLDITIHPVGPKVHRYIELSLYRIHDPSCNDRLLYLQSPLNTTSGWTYLFETVHK
ncbi:hypothetical protein BDC45DRAFT_597975 [Circinella umbellata]|nr:hypothetical protein BDC45DRAFT_597975 [Circinella umbellata]